MAEFRLEKLDARVITNSRGGGSAQIERGGSDSELFRVAEYVAIAPGNSTAAAEIGRIRGVDRHRVTLALAKREGDRHAAGRVDSFAHIDADRGEWTQRQQVAARRLDRGGTVLSSRRQRKASADQLFVDALQTLEPDFADGRSLSGIHAETHVEDGERLVFIRHRRGGLFENVPPPPQRPPQTRPPRPPHRPHPPNSRLPRENPLPRLPNPAPHFHPSP